MVVAERARADRFEHLLGVLKRMTFGKRSEKMSADQLALALEDRDVALAEIELLTEQNEEVIGAPLERRRRRADTPRASLPLHLPRHEIEIAPAACQCAACGGALHRIGEDRAERLDIVPAQYRVLVTIRPKMACRACGDGVAQASASKHVVPGGLPSESLIADVLVKKYADHLPLYRQSQILARQGIAIERATLANWVGRAAGYLRPLVELQKARLLTCDRLFVDETTAKVLAPGNGKTKTGYMWAMVGDDRPYGGADPPAIVYSYMPGRGGVWAAKLLGDYRGILQVDGYEAYGQFGKADRPGGPAALAYCWAHVRRGFFDATKGKGAPIAEEGLRRIGALYEIEREIRGRSADERRIERQVRARPLLDELHGWLEEKRRRMFSGSPTLEPINYALRRWIGLTRYVDDGRVDIDNNAVERSMRTMALQRKNALFAGHELGAENWATIASLVETCKLVGHKPDAYLADVLARIVVRRDGDTLDDLLPGNWSDTKAANIAPVSLVLCKAA
ncbi:IS66 family transposase [Sphingosinicella rhizophila]|uniref:IS66 family transposase n=1 Tax=Sphingosinicella rhizophila TaxID=3050082 RepID=A0ABU3QC24_9SPHN|nr:IS66 family transposase [Sphingosinicella sp. GR2756]MDT9600951.1 IS66 family transposase [Sphingosinicella sp. GR2756]